MNQDLQLNYAQSKKKGIQQKETDGQVNMINRWFRILSRSVGTPKSIPGTKRYYFNGNGAWNNTGFGENTVFQCTAINPKNAIRKYQNSAL